MAVPPIPDRTETLAPRANATPEVGGRRGEPEDRAQAREAELDDLAADDPDRYEQVNEHARGGLGRVVRAVDRRLGRTVAVKELLRHDPANEARFLREAMITARLEHPGIVPVHEAGRWPNGDPYYVMKLVEGRTLKELIAEAATLRDRLGLLPHVIAVADAVGYAHSEGVIHRDLKPSNVVVGSFGETIVVDWGLARDRKRDLPEPAEEQLAVGSASTVSGKVVGTPAYMSPEQARGDAVDERADVYALGAVLYELLAGAPPHADATPQAVLDRVIAGPPRPLPMVVPSVPGELATIVRKAMARDPAARYPHAVALAEDLRRFTTGKLVSAHSYSTWALLRKRLSRHRGIVAVVVASLVVLGAVGIESVRRVVAERNIARSALISAERRKRELVLLQAETALPRDPTAALAWLKGYRLGPDDRTKVVDVIDEALALGVARHVFRPGDWVIDVRFTPDGKTVVAAVRDGILRAYNVRTGTVTELGKTPSVPTALTMTGDGAFAITGGATGEVIAWPLRGGTPRMVLEPGGRAISRLRLSGDGRVLVERDWSAPQVVSLEGGAPDVLAPTFGLKFAVAERDWSHVVMATSATELVVPDPTGARALAHTDMAIEFLAVSPRGDTVIVHDGTTIWSVPYAGGELHEVARYKDKLHTVVWSDDGRTMAIGGALPEILMVDTQTGATTELRGHTDAIYTLELSHDGTQLLSASDDATARVWRLANRTATVLRGHDDDVYSARFSADERSVATASLDGSARVWDIDRPSSSTFVEAEPIEAVRFDGASALATTRDVIARWNFATGQREQLFEAEADAHGFGASVVSPDGERVVVPHPDGSLELRDRDGNTATLRGHHGLVTHVEFTHDGSALYSSSNDGTLRRWSVATGAGSIVLEGATPIRGFAVARDGRIAAQAGEAAYLIDPTGAVSQLGKGGSWCIKFAEFEPISDRLALYRCDGTLALYDRGKLVELATGGYAVTHIAVSRDGRLIAGGLTDRTVRLWSADSGRVLDILHGHSDLVLDVAFSPDGETLASASYDKTIGLWDLTSRRHRVLRGHTAAVNWLVWRGSAHLATGSSDGTIRVWDVPSLALPSESEIAARLNGATSAQIDLDRPESSAQVTRGT